MTKQTKQKVTGGMFANTYALMIQCVESGIAYGYRRAHKHTDSPTEDDICNAIYAGVMNEICEWFCFEHVATEE